jgi:hypothetical protein
MTATTRIGGFVFTSTSFLCCPGALGGSTRRLFGFAFAFIAAIGSHCPIMYFTDTTIGLASITLKTKQLNVGGIATSAAREWRNMVVF